MDENYGGLGGLGGFFDGLKPVGEGIDRFMDDSALNLIMMGASLIDNGRPTVNGPRPMGQVIAPFMANMGKFAERNQEREALGVALRGAGVPEEEIPKLQRNMPAAKLRLDQITNQRNMDATDRFIKQDQEMQGGPTQAPPARMTPPAPPIRATGQQRSDAGGSDTPFFRLIGQAEGTDKGRGYDETLGYGKFTGGPVDLQNMTVSQVLGLQKSILGHPENGFNSSATGRYQVVGRTLGDLVQQGVVKSDEPFNAETQNKVAAVLAQRRGPDPAELRKEWAGLRNVPDDQIISAWKAQFGGGAQQQTRAPQPQTASVASATQGSPAGDGTTPEQVPMQNRAFTRPQTVAIRKGVDIENIGEGPRKIVGALSQLEIPGLEIVSGFRDPQRNARVGGAKGSQHIHGNAIDVNITNLTPEQRQVVIDTAIANGAKGMGIYPGGRSLHFDTRETPAVWGGDPNNPYRGVADPSAYPSWAQAGVAKLLGGEAGGAMVATAQPRPQVASARATAFAPDTPVDPRLVPKAFARTQQSAPADVDAPRQRVAAVEPSASAPSRAAPPPSARPQQTRLGVPVARGSLNSPVSPVTADNPGVLDFLRLEAESRMGNPAQRAAVAPASAPVSSRVRQSDEAERYPVAPVTSENLAPATANQQAAPTPAPALVSSPTARPSAMTPEEMMASPDWQTRQASDEEFDQMQRVAKGEVQAPRAASTGVGALPAPSQSAPAAPISPPASVVSEAPSPQVAQAGAAPELTPGSPAAMRAADQVKVPKYSEKAMDPTEYKDGSQSQRTAQERRLRFLAAGMARGAAMGEGGKALLKYSEKEYDRLAKSMEPTDLMKNVESAIAELPEPLRAPTRARLIRQAIPDSRSADLQALDRLLENPEQSDKYMEIRRSGVQQTPPPINPLVTDMTKQFTESREAAINSRKMIDTIHNARTNLDGEVKAILGAGANPRLQLAKVAQFFGVDNAEKISQTENFRANIGEAVLTRAKTLGSNPSSTDRDYIMAVMGGSIDLDESSIRKILDIQENGARKTIADYNRRFDSVLKTLETDPRKDPNTAQALALTRALGRVDEAPAYETPADRKNRLNPPAKAAPAAPDPARTTDGWTDYGDGVRVRIKP
jgi:hypothetical protein